MRRLAAVCAVLLMGAGSAHAQSNEHRFYTAPSVSVDVGSRGMIRLGAVPAMGVLLGVRVGGGWSIEGEIERGVRSRFYSQESFWVSYPPVPTTSREDFERYGIKARFDRTHRAGPGWSALAMWRSREPGRLNVGVLMGVSARTFELRTGRTTTFVSPEIDLPPTHPSVLSSVETRRMTATGLTGGVVILGRITNTLTIGPEIRVTRGFITDDPFTLFRTGVRVAWDF